MCWKVVDMAAINILCNNMIVTVPGILYLLYLEIIMLCYETLLEQLLEGGGRGVRGKLARVWEV